MKIISVEKLEWTTLIIIGSLEPAENKLPIWCHLQDFVFFLAAQNKVSIARVWYSHYRFGVSELSGISDLLKRVNFLFLAMAALFLGGQYTIVKSWESTTSFTRSKDTAWSCFCIKKFIVGFCSDKWKVVLMDPFWIIQVLMSLILRNRWKIVFKTQFSFLIHMPWQWATKACQALAVLLIEELSHNNILINFSGLNRKLLLTLWRKWRNFQIWWIMLLGFG